MIQTAEPPPPAPFKQTVRLLLFQSIRNQKYFNLTSSQKPKVNNIPKNYKNAALVTVIS